MVQHEWHRTESFFSTIMETSAQTLLPDCAYRMSSSTVDSVEGNQHTTFSIRYMITAQSFAGWIRNWTSNAIVGNSAGDETVYRYWRTMAGYTCGCVDKWVTFPDRNTALKSDLYDRVHVLRDVDGESGSWEGHLSGYDGKHIMHDNIQDKGQNGSGDDSGIYRNSEMNRKPHTPFE